MDFNLDNKSNIPIFKQIICKILDSINNDEFGKDGKLPTERKLCEEFNVSRGTIKKVFAELEQMGKIRKIQGKGTYATGDHMHEKHEFIIDSMRNLIDNLYSINFNEVQIRDIVMKELWKRLKDDEKISIAWVDCSRELLEKSSLYIEEKCNVKVKCFLIDDIKNDSELLKDKFDFIVTTINHINEINKILNHAHEKVESVILKVSSKTISQIAGLKEKDKVAVIYESFNFLNLVNENLQNKGMIYNSREISINLGIEEIRKEIEKYNTVIVPEEYYDFINDNLENNNINIIAFEYVLDDGSLINLLDKAEKYWINKCNN